MIGTCRHGESLGQECVRCSAAPICAKCNDKGMVRVDIDCDDPQCGDSTWDHNCTMGSRMQPCECKFGMGRTQPPLCEEGKP